MAQTEEDLAKVEAEQQQVQQKTNALRSAVQQLAVLRYVQGAVDTGGLLLGSRVSDQLQADQYAEIAARAGAQDVDTYETSLQDLERSRVLLETAKKKSAQAAANFKAQRKNLEKIAALQKAEEQRQKDAAVRRALEAIAAEQRRQAEAAAAKAAAEAAARASALGGSPAIGSRVYVASGLLCPVAGPSTFVDTWGAARSGGRRHQASTCSAPVARLPWPSWPGRSASPRTASAGTRSGSTGPTATPTTTRTSTTMGRVAR